MPEYIYYKGKILPSKNESVRLQRTPDKTYKSKKKEVNVMSENENNIYQDDFDLPESCAEEFDKQPYDCDISTADGENDTPSGQDDPSGGGQQQNKQPALIEQIYQAINEVIGGTNENQIFCMMSPGTTLNPSDYRYDTEGEKPATVAANESRLVNKLFDPCHVTGSDNGRSLPTQFLSALNVLTPKLNPELARAKNVLRTMLTTKIKYDFDDGPVEATFQQIFYRLYEEWVEEKRKWAKVQSDKKAEIRAKYGDNTDKNKKKIEEEYLEWYQIEAEPYLLAVEAKLGKVLGLFSVDDMQIIEGVLNSSVGSELYEAKTSVLNAKRYNPDGGATYPVTLTPSDWPKLLDSNFDAIDLLDTPDALMQKYRTLSERRLSLANQIARFERKDKSGELQNAINDLNQKKSEYDEQFNEVIKTYGNGAVALAKTVAGFFEKAGSETDFLYKMQCEKATSDSGKQKNIDFKALKTILQQSSKAQTAFVTAAQKLAEAGRTVIADKTMEFSDILIPLIKELDDVNKQIDDIQARVKSSVSISKEPTDLTARAAENEFMEVIISTDASSTQSAGSLKSSSSDSNYGVSFWLGGYSESKSKAESTVTDFSSSSENKIDIGFHVTKVDISRAWFNPGVFKLSNDMFNIAGKRVSYNPNEHQTDQTESNILDEMNKCIFPCFPTSFVIAKDVTIRLSNATSMSDTMRSVMDEHVARGGGVFCFSGSAASSSSSESSSAKVQNTEKGLTIKFPGAQILGYYLEKTPPDESHYLTTGEMKEDISIEEFIDSCKQMMETLHQQ